MVKSFFVIAVLGLSLIAFAGPACTANCEDLLGDNVYRCQVRNGKDMLNDDCLRFNSTTPSISQYFDLSIDLFGDTLGCSCNPTGSFDNPSFGASKEWVCLTPDAGFVWVGKVAGKGKISKVFAADIYGTTYVFNCVVDPTCATTPGPGVETLTVPSAQNQYVK